MTAPRHALSDAAFVILALVGEGEAHGYQLQRLVRERGFRYWTDIKRSTIYNLLSSLERAGLIAARVVPGSGPVRRVYSITRSGIARLREEAVRHLSSPGHPRSELDLGVYAVPFLSRAEARAAFRRALTHLRAREAFLEERLEWCRARGLVLPALAFERPLVALQAEVVWLERLADAIEQGVLLRSADWAEYVYRKPPGSGPEVAARRRRRKLS